MTRTRRPLAAFLAAIVAAFVFGACGTTLRDTVNPVAATVNGNAISQTKLDDEMDAMAANKAYLSFLEKQGNAALGKGRGAFNLAFVSRVLTRQIYLELVHEEFLRRKLTITDGDRQQVQADVAQEVGGPEIFQSFPLSYRDELVRRTAEVTKVQIALAGENVDTAALRAYYDQNQDEFVETCVSHILFAVLQPNGQVDSAGTEAQSAQLQAAAAAARARIMGGEDFAAVAKELSQDKSNSDQGGDLQCGPAGRFVPEFERAMDTLQPGQVSEPVKTQFGWHLIKVTSRGPKPFDQVENDIRQRLLGQAQQGFGNFLAEKVGRATISVNPRYGHFKKGSNPTIEPPSPPSTPDVGGMSGEAGGGPALNPLQLGG